MSAENTEEIPRSHKRRPTVSVKKPKSSSISEEHIAVDIEIDIAKKDKEDGASKERKPSPMVTKKAAAPTVNLDLGKDQSWFLSVFRNL